MNRAQRRAGAAEPWANSTRRGQAPLYVNGKKVHGDLRYCHQLVKEIAEGIAHELYAGMMRCDTAYAVWQRFCEDIDFKKHGESEFVRLALPFLLDDARATMAKMLGDSIYSHLHASLYDALIKDGEVRHKGRLNVVRPLIEEAYRGRR